MIKFPFLSATNVVSIPYKRGPSQGRILAMQVIIKNKSLMINNLEKSHVPHA